MELKISEKIKEYRRVFGVTQEKFAQDIGISSQAVSKWERGDGYPDITLLPTIANYFGITIDELVGNDKNVDERIKKRFYEEAENLNLKDRLEVAEKYYKQYPENNVIAYDFAQNIYMYCSGNREAISSYLPTLRKICEHLIANGADWYERYCIKDMYVLCDESEKEYWAHKNNDYHFLFGSEWEEERCWVHGEHEKSREICALNRTAAMYASLSHNTRYTASSARYEKAMDSRLRLMEGFGEGSVPQGWMGLYIWTKLCRAASLFDLGRKEEGYSEVEACIELEKERRRIPKGTPLYFGDEGLFAKVYAKQGEVKIYSNENLCINHYANTFFARLADIDIYYALTAPKGWEWFNSVREEERFRTLTEKAKEIAE